MQPATHEYTGVSPVARPSGAFPHMRENLLRLATSHFYSKIRQLNLTFAVRFC